MPHDEKKISKEIYFEHKLTDIKSTDIVPKMDYNTITGYENLGRASGFHVGKMDRNDNLICLETWNREYLENVDLNTIISGKALHDYDIPIQGDELDTQNPVFFMKDGDNGDWFVVPTDKTIGDSYFIRLKWVKPVRSDNLVKAASLIHQSLASVEEFSYGGDGSSITKKVRLFEDGKIKDEFTITDSGELIRP